MSRRKGREAMKPLKGAPPQGVAKVHSLLQLEQLKSRVMHRAKLIQLSGSCCRGMQVPRHDISILAARVQITVAVATLQAELHGKI